MPDIPARKLSFRLALELGLLGAHGMNKLNKEGDQSRYSCVTPAKLRMLESHGICKQIDKRSESHFAHC